MKNSFILYTDNYPTLQLLSVEEKGQLFDIIFQYHLTGEVPEIQALPVKMAFSFLKQQFDRDLIKYNKIVERNKSNIGKRWNKKNTKNTNGKNGIPKNTKNTDSDSDSDSDLNKESNKLDSMSGDESPDALETIDYKKLVDWFNLETKGVFGKVKYPLSDNRKKHEAVLKAGSLIFLIRRLFDKLDKKSPLDQIFF